MGAKSSKREAKVGFSWRGFEGESGPGEEGSTAGAEGRPVLEELLWASSRGTSTGLHT